MAKRGADSELNDRNWNDEVEPEEAGVFEKAPEDVLQHRVMKKAKRRVLTDEGPSSKTAAFTGFSGLGKPAQSKPLEPFSGFKNLDGKSGFGVKPISLGGASSFNGTEDLTFKGQGDTKETSSYLNFLKSLNESVLAWIKKHVDDNPYIILTPIFKDYETYLATVQPDTSVVSSSKKDASREAKNNDNCNKAITNSNASSATKPTAEDKSKFTFGQATSESSSTKGFAFEPSNSTAGRSFKFGQSSETATSSGSKPASFGSTFSSQSGGFSLAAATSSLGAAIGQIKFSTTPQSDTAFKFGQSSETSTISGSKPAFSFGSTFSSQSGGFSLAAATSSQGAGTSQDTDAKDDEEYVPPKPEVKVILEEDALFSIRCKLFHQKEGKWVDRGVGNLHLKPVGEEKSQLLVRADTNLGNILLNIMLSSTMPVSRQGKNNVMLVCVPNPPIDTKADADNTPVPMLIRVKTEEDADNLVAKIEERKRLL
ncbi:unnamed protein product [Lymnaea stagnalis]|uniref:RanBD1 domain-containing protein n=1 Tax=Lymnaea stagnalis TaxID=6523 RepID=A0AAV2I4C9_LYMST